MRRIKLFDPQEKSSLSIRTDSVNSDKAEKNYRDCQTSAKSRKYANISLGGPPSHF